jgi:uncharacterized membrane protein
MMNWDWDYMMNGWIGGWMWIPMALLLALLAFVVVAVFRATATGAPYSGEAPLAIASRRLARGEITKDEYEDLRTTLAADRARS